MSLSKKVLKLPERSGKNKANLTNILNKRIKNFTFSLDVNETLNKHKPKKSKNISQNRLISNKIESGDIKGAVRIISSDDSVAECNMDVYNKLLSKHPQKNSVRVFKNLETSAEINFGAVKNYINSFPPGSAGGPDGLKPQILKDLIHEKNGEIASILIQKLTDFVNIILHGNVPVCVRPVFFGANLTALNKKDGGVRPIAVGNTFRRLASKCAGFLVKNERIASYKNVQLGYGVPKGCESAAHAVRNYINSIDDDNFVLFKVDFKNAFNCIDREKLLLTIYEKYPAIFNYTNNAYGQNSYLFFGDQIILSSVGAQQGDPEGPPLFSDIINPIIQNFSCDLNVWYLDDGNFADNYQKVIATYSYLKTEAEKIGLSVNPSKCEIVFLGSPVNGKKKKIMQEFYEVCPGVSETEIKDLVILGAPIGDKAVENCLSEKLNTFSNMAKNLEKIDTHYAFFLLKNCLHVPKMNYFLRTAPCFLKKEILIKFDQCLIECLKKTCNIGLNSLASMQIQLPVRLSGMGIPSVVNIAPSAYLASVTGSFKLISNILHGKTFPDIYSNSALCAWQNQVSSTVLPCGSPFQKDWLEPVHEKIFSDIISGCNEYNKKRLTAFKGKFQGSWLNALPSKSLGLKCTDAQFRISFALRTGSKICEKHICSCETPVDELGTHGLSCKKSAGRFSRHSHLNDFFKRTIGTAGYNSVLEPPGLCRSDGKRPDGMTLIPWSRGQSLVWDVTVVDSLAPSRICRDVNHIKEAEERKAAKYTEISNSGYLFQPLAFDTQGNCGPSTKSFLKDLGDKLVNISGDKRAKEFLYQSITSIIIQHNAACVLGTLDKQERMDEIFTLL